VPKGPAGGLRQRAAARTARRAEREAARRGAGILERNVPTVKKLVTRGLPAAARFATKRIIAPLAAAETVYQSGKQVYELGRQVKESVEAQKHLKRTARHARKYGVRTTQRPVLYGLLKGPEVKVRNKYGRRID
jgi:hypothetical protein